LTADRGEGGGRSRTRVTPPEPERPRSLGTGTNTPFPTRMLTVVSGATHKRGVTVVDLAGDIREWVEKAVEALRKAYGIAESSLSGKRPEGRGVSVRSPLSEAELVTAIRQHRSEVTKAATVHGARNLQTFSEKAIETRPVLVADLDRGRDYFDVDALEEEIGALTGLRPHIVTLPSLRPEERKLLTPLS